MSIAVVNPRTGAADYSIEPVRADTVSPLAADLRARQRAWLELGAEGRAGSLRRLAESVARHREALVAALIDDTGRAGLSSIEVDSVIGMLNRWAQSAPALIARYQASGQSTAIPSITTSTRLVPYSLVGVISPWNFPLLLSMIDTVPALAAGCAVIVKPSEITPRFIRPLMQAIAEVPEVASVLTVIEGDGSTGGALIPNVDFVAFTGSVATGRKVGESAARAFIPASLELGGKDPLIVLASADPVKAAEIALRASVVNTGQACQSIERVYVARPIAERFLATLVEKAQAVRLNYPDIKVGDIGPFISARQADIVQTQIDDAVSRGAKLLAGGRVETLGGGKYLRPTVLTEVTPDMLVMAEETFGPVIPVTIFDSADEAVAHANAGIFGLSAAVLAGTTEDAEPVAARINAGAVSINDGSLTTMVWEAEKSSFGASGLGPSRMGDSGLLRFFRKQLLIRQSGAPAPLAAYSEEGLRPR
ncbi:aldehyde dehydrogenase family protein [Steroidobacter agaridevorans]|uniref:aldehyde dehydrogenase family protein n=1 Tax=Steroidobacter agaridevorans TaxID=2695856 RepID=UPI00132939F0|nr:aldehyde dehydrogenase family protein [Steroidobacter agaridevorans]GFE87476.1 aldehyde dehydrogenase [Steroidobacter agaridevorans]